VTRLPTLSVVLPTDVPVEWQLDGHHVHRFIDNARLGKAAFAPLGNLPAAAPLDETVGSFRDFIRVVRDEFRISGIDKCDPPDWQWMF
jgi:hypothetical protein